LSLSTLWGKGGKKEKRSPLLLRKKNGSGRGGKSSLEKEKRGESTFFGKKKKREKGPRREGGTPSGEGAPVWGKKTRKEGTLFSDRRRGKKRRRGENLLKGKKQKERGVSPRKRKDEIKEEISLILRDKNLRKRGKKNCSFQMRGRKKRLSKRRGKGGPKKEKENPILGRERRGETTFGKKNECPKKGGGP